MEQSEVQQLDFLPSDTQRVDDVYVHVTALSYSEAWDLVQVQSASTFRDFVKLSRQADAERRKGQEIDDTGKLLRREKDGHMVKWALVMGKAGSGKTILCQKVLSDWLNKPYSHLRKYAAVIYVSGKDHIRLKENNLSRFLKLDNLFDEAADVSDVISYLKTNSKKLLFLFDGGDEVDKDGILSQGEIITGILQGRLFPDASVVMTSRPCADVFDLLRLQRVKFGLHFSLAGLKYHQLENMARLRLSDGAQRFLQDLNEPGKEHMKTAAQDTPLFAALMLEVYRDGQLIPRSVTELYVYIVESVKNRFVVKKLNLELHESSGGQTSEETWSQVAKAAVNCLSRLALKNLQSHSPMFTSTQVQFFLDRVPNAEHLGLLTQALKLGDKPDQRLFSFQHLSFQEFLAAKEIANSNNFLASLQRALHEIGTDQHTWLFWRFLAGLVCPYLLPELILRLSNVLEVQPQLLESRTKLFFLMSCIAQQTSPEAEGFTGLASSVIASEGHWDLNDSALLVPDASSLAFLIQSFQIEQTLTLRFSSLNVEHVRILQPAFTCLSMAFFDGTSLSGEPLHYLVRGLAKSKCLKQLSLRYCKLKNTDGEQIKFLLTHCTCLQALLLGYNNLGGTGAVTACQGLNEASPLKHLSLEMNDLSDVDGSALRMALSKAQFLQSLEFGSCCLRDEQVAGLLDQLKLNKLAFVHLSQNELTASIFPTISHFIQVKARNCLLSDKRGIYFVVSDNLISESECVQAHQNLFLEDVPYMLTCGNVTVTNFSVDNHHLAEGLVLQVFRRAKESNNHDLGLEDGMIGDSTIELAASVLLTNVSFQAATLCNNGLSDKVAPCLCNVLEGSPHLKGMDISRNKISAVGAAALCRTLSSSAVNLLYLNLSQNKIFTADSSSSALFYSFLVGCPNLKILMLHSTGLSDLQLCSLAADMSSRLCPLDVLTLSDNSIGDHGAVALVSWFSKRNAPRFISLSGNRITHDGAENLAKTFCEIPDSQQPECVWMGGNDVPPSFYESCREKFFADAEFSFFYRVATEALGTFLPDVNLSGEDNDRETRMQAIEKRNAKHIAEFMFIQQFQVLGTCLQLGDTVGFLCLLQLGLRCLSLGFTHDCEEYLTFLKGLFAFIRHWVKAGVDNIHPILLCVSLSLLNELSLCGEMDSTEADIGEYIQLLLQCQETGLGTQTERTMQCLVELSKERGLPPLAERLQSQMAVLGYNV